MKSTRIRIASRFVAAAILLAASAGAVSAEPHLLSRQYPRCTSCHISPTGGGLLSSYGRSLSHVELSTFNQPAGSHDESAPPGEEGFLFGLLGNSLGPLQLGVDLRPSRLEMYFPGGFNMGRNILMTADLDAGIRVNNWVGFGAIGRRPEDDGGELVGPEYWGGWLPDHGFGIRGGRFLPAYGVKFADHTSFNREYLDLAQDDQVFGVEASYTTERYLLQGSVGPGRADSIIDDDGRQSFTATGRAQADLSSRMVLVGSGMYRNGSRESGRHSSTGVAFGLSPASRVTIWNQADAEFEQDEDSTSYVLVNETSVELVRGLWFKVSPQAVLGGGRRTSDLFRLGLGTVFLPRTHWNVNVSFYVDHNQDADVTTKTLMMQLHMYL